jgi:hypothetical protein
MSTLGTYTRIVFISGLENNQVSSFEQISEASVATLIIIIFFAVVQSLLGVKRCTHLAIGTTRWRPVTSFICISLPTFADLELTSILSRL